jgi:hypothetical protein
MGNDYKPDTSKMPQFVQDAVAGFVEHVDKETAKMQAAKLDLSAFKTMAVSDQSLDGGSANVSGPGKSSVREV